MLTVGLLLSVSACRTAEVYEASSLGDITLSKIESSIESGDPIPALQDLSALRNLKSLPVDRVEKISREAADAIRTKFYSAIDEEDFVSAYALIQSLEMLSYDDDMQEWDSASVLEALADSATEERNDLVALILLLKASQNTASRFRILSEMRDLAAESGYHSFGRYASDVLGTNSQSASRSLTNRTPSGAVGTSPRALTSEQVSRMIDGTVTIWVNRGIRIERGVGYPDAVIGSGFFIDEIGHVVTNYHVIESEVDPEYEGFSRLYVRPPFDESQKIPAKVVGYDRLFDLALLKVDLEPDYVYSPTIGVSSHPGDQIYAIGSPVGLTRTITSGIVSAVGRRFLQMGDVIQVDVPINPGNSGGPLVNESGELIGIVFAGIEQFEGINFAIPSRWMLSSIPRLYEGEVRYPWLGASVTDVGGGLEVVYLIPGEPAERAGLLVGDIIVSIADQVVVSTEAMQAMLIELLPGTLAPVEWTRDGTRMDGAVALTARPDYPVDLALDRDTPDNLIPPLFGMFLTMTERSIFGNRYVVDRVIRAGVADEAGLSEDDPLSIRDYHIDQEQRIALMQIVVQKRKAGFIERTIQIGTYLEIETFI